MKFFCLCEILELALQAWEIVEICFTFLKQGSLNYPFGRNQTMQMYGNFEGFPLDSALFGLVI